jgi:hypothetical protein
VTASLKKAGQVVVPHMTYCMDLNQGVLAKVDDSGMAAQQMADWSGACHAPTGVGLRELS